MQKNNSNLIGKRILIIEDDRDMAFLLSTTLQKKGYKTTTAFDGSEGFKKISIFDPHLILSDINLPKLDGFKLLEKVKKINDDIVFIMITAFGDIKDSVTAMKMGAFDYITKPFNHDELFIIIQKALNNQELNEEVIRLRKQLSEKSEDFIGNSTKIKNVLKLIDIIAPTDMSVIIQGESGTGKELIARMIHNKSNRHDKIFLAVDCGTIPDTLLESELFGHEKGSFTSANSTKIGKFEQADNGTIFLDEISNLTKSAQVKFLRVIQERKLYRIGSKKPINVNIRIIGATNIDMSKLIKSGRFREDLFHRLDEFSITIPSLIDREDDITLLAEHFVKIANKTLNKNVKTISSEATMMLLKHSWTGNVRELKNIIKRAVLLSGKGIIKPEHILFSLNCTDENEIILNEVNLDKAKKETEKVIIKKVLRQVNGSRIKASELLGITRKSLYLKIKNYNIEPNK